MNEAPRKCRWCPSLATGTALIRQTTPAGWGTELGGRFASCGRHGIGFVRSEPVCKHCDDYGVLDGLEPCPAGCEKSREVLANLSRSDLPDWPT